MRQEKILVAEDEAAISMLVEEILQGLGYTNIYLAFDAVSAERMILEQEFDMVLMDINLGGGKDGIDIMNAVRSQQIDVPFVYITGNSDFKTITKAKYSKPDGVIVKPINEMDFMVLLELIFHKRSSAEKSTVASNPKIHRNPLAVLSEREKEILEKIVTGYSNKMIAEILLISDKTVSIHRTHIMKKLSAKNAADLVRIALTG